MSQHCLLTGHLPPVIWYTTLLFTKFLRSISGLFSLLHCSVHPFMDHIIFILRSLWDILISCKADPQSMIIFCLVFLATISYLFLHIKCRINLSSFRKKKKTCYFVRFTFTYNLGRSMEKHNLCEERTLDNYLFKTTFASFMIF